MAVLKVFLALNLTNLLLPSLITVIEVRFRWFDEIVSWFGIVNFLRLMTGVTGLNSAG